MSGLAGSYCGPAPLPAELFARWNLDPVVLAALALLALAVRRERAGWAAVAVLGIALVSPLCALSAALFSARVVHHVLIVAVAAPLLALARPASRPARAALPFLAATAVLWLWHAPGPYDAALAHKGVYAAMQISLLGSAFCYWRAVFSRRDPGAVLWVLFGYMAMGLLGALLTLAPAPLYAAHASAPLLWGLAPLADQQLGGLVMWFPAGLAFAAWGLVVARRLWSDASAPEGGAA